MWTRLVHLVGIIQCFLGYFLIWAFVIGLITRPPVAAMCLFMLLAAHAMSFFNTANVVTSVRNFPDHSGIAVGIMKECPRECGVLDFVLCHGVWHGFGARFTTVNNLGQIGESLGYSSSEANTLVSLWSIWNFLGGFGAGYVSDHFLYVKRLARPLFMVLTLATMSVGNAVIAYGLPGTLYAGSILVGVCYGSQWSLMPTIVSEIFGVRHMGTIFNTITVASPVGSCIFSMGVVGYIYDSEASESGCKGSHCFMLSFLIMASATLLGSLAALALFYRAKRFYSQVILGRLLHSL
ncbi:transcription initiation factor IIB-2-like [Hibiscus syriacus]|uniref:Transcription initiation factor IIB-2-like n=1 Tax=Hibiscus syriacus TaxID=106335 RepID=A0A6A3ASY9_HIBSY|nr:transcription initiation factor IIB-2-like [Hibiscus syriacus]